MSIGDGGWTNFTDWSACSRPCETGFSIRTRTCTNPPPTGGADCVGSATEIQTCNTQVCPGMYTIIMLSCNHSRAI